MFLFPQSVEPENDQQSTTLEWNDSDCRFIEGTADTPGAFYSTPNVRARTCTLFFFSLCRASFVIQSSLQRLRSHVRADKTIPLGSLIDFHRTRWGSLLRTPCLFTSLPPNHPPTSTPSLLRPPPAPPHPPLLLPACLGLSATVV